MIAIPYRRPLDREDEKVCWSRLLQARNPKPFLTHRTLQPNTQAAGIPPGPCSLFLLHCQGQKACRKGIITRWRSVTFFLDVHRTKLGPLLPEGPKMRGRPCPPGWALSLPTPLLHVVSGFQHLVELSYGTGPESLNCKIQTIKGLRNQKNAWVPPCSKEKTQEENLLKDPGHKCDDGRQGRERQHAFQ